MNYWTPDAAEISLMNNDVSKWSGKSNDVVLDRVREGEGQSLSIKAL